MRTMKADPEYSTIVERAECRHCQKPIERRPITRHGWWHSNTGKENCNRFEDDE